MSGRMLWHEVTRIRQTIKHVPESIDRDALEGIRQTLGEVEDALDVLYSLTAGADLTTVADEDEDGWIVTLKTHLPDRRPLLEWMSS
jgi:hypothetical protein